jgi:hypothetical protein
MQTALELKHQWAVVSKENKKERDRLGERVRQLQNCYLLKDITLSTKRDWHLLQQMFEDGEAEEYVFGPGIYFFYAIGTMVNNTVEHWIGGRGHGRRRINTEKSVDEALSCLPIATEFLTTNFASRRPDATQTSQIDSIVTKLSQQPDSADRAALAFALKSLIS